VKARPLVRIKRDKAGVRVRFNAEVCEQLDLHRFDRIAIIADGDSIAFRFSSVALEGERSYSLQRDGGASRAARFVCLGRRCLSMVRSGIYSASGDVSRLVIAPLVAIDGYA
jgi:hypothetical protein